MVSGAIADGVSVTLNGAGGTRTATTSAGGSFAFADVANGSYTLTPLRDGYAFTPPSIPVIVSDSDVNNNNFTAVSVLHSISGSISGDVADGVTVALSGVFSGTTTTSGGGHFNFPNLQNGVYTVTPSAAGFRFLPESRTVTLSGADATSIDFASGEASKSIYTLTVLKDGSGSGAITGAGLDCGTTCSVRSFDGSILTLTATAAPYSVFSSWSGCEVTSGVNCSLTITSDRTLTAVFAVLQLKRLAGEPSGIGSTDGTAESARFNDPLGIVASASGDLYVADSGNFTIRQITTARVVTTLAGRTGYSGSNDGAGANAYFNGVGSIALDASGNLYVTDAGNHTIRTVTSAGVVVTLAGKAGTSGSADGTGTAARFNFPSGVALDASGNAYVTDTGNHTIRKVTPSGVVTTLAGMPGASGSADGTGTAAKFNSPENLAADSSGNLYVVDRRNRTIRKVTPGGLVTTLAGSAGSPGSDDGVGASARFGDLTGITVDASGNVYVSDWAYSTIRKVTPSGVVTTPLGKPGLSGSEDGTGSSARFRSPSGLGADATGNLYLTDTGNQTVRKVTPALVVTTLAGRAPLFGGVDGTGAAARFSGPAQVAVGASGDIYVADSGNHAIRKVTLAGAVTTIAGTLGSYGSADGTAASARFFGPEGIAVDVSGNLYVADSANHTVRKITSSGVVTTLAGTPGSAGSADGSGAAARFNYPKALAVDGSGTVYVADTFNQTIRKVTSDGTVVTLAGVAGSMGTADGIGTTARFNYPGGITVDAIGDLYVSDTSNHTIRKVAASGKVSTIAGTPGMAHRQDGTGTNAGLFSPAQITVDASGALYVADVGNNAIRRVTRDGVVTTAVGVSGPVVGNLLTNLPAALAFPTGVAADGTGNLFISVQHALLEVAP